MIAAIGAYALLSVSFTGQVAECAPVLPAQPVSVSDTQAAPLGSPSILVVLVNADGTLAGEMRSSKVPSRVEVQVFEENTASDSEMVVKPEDKQPMAQSFVWMRDLVNKVLNRSFNAKSRSHPCSTISGYEKVVIVREVTDEEAATTEPVEQRAERAITGILGA
jgi:hypothetical protein